MKKIGEHVISAIRIIATAVLWLAALIYLYFFLFKDQSTRNRTLLLFLFLTIVSLVIVTSIMIWRAYNARRFGKLDRRRFINPVTTEEIGKLFGLNSVFVESLQASQSLTLSVTRQYDGNDKNKVIREIITISGEGAKYRISRLVVPQDISAYTRMEGGRR